MFSPVQFRAVGRHLKAHDVVSAARADVPDVMGWCNAAQVNSRLGDLTPDQHHFAKLPAQARRGVAVKAIIAAVTVT